MTARSGRLVGHVARFVINVALAYLAAGTVLLVSGAIAYAIEPPGGLSLVEWWVVGMFWLLVGFPVVLLGIGILSLLVLASTWPPRRTAVVASISPGVGLLLAVAAEPAVFSIAAWLLATGLLFGLLMRLPPQTVTGTASPDKTAEDVREAT